MALAMVIDPAKVLPMPWKAPVYAAYSRFWTWIAARRSNTDP